MSRRRFRMTAVACALGLAAGLAAPASGAALPQSSTTPAIFVGNNWDGTADVVEVGGEYRRIARINIIPDLRERQWEILRDPVRLIYVVGIRLLVGEGHDQYVDDMFSTPDGRLLVVSRPSLGDVVGIELATGDIAWRFRVAGMRADHMAMSPDGTQVAVSASTGNVVHILDANTGTELGQFESGDSPHENNYSADGSKIYHASIGLVYTPLDQPILDSTKGERYFQVVDANTHEVLERVDIGEKLAEAGYPDMSSAVRPMAHTADERFFYLQVSFFHGFVEYDMKTDEVRRVASLPNYVPDMPREQYLLDSAHHGIAMSGDDEKLCVAGTMSDYVAMVDRRSFDANVIPGGENAKPYWATTSEDGEHCYVSWSGLDEVSVISYDTEEEVARFSVGDHPQRVRTGVVPAEWAASRR